MLSRVWSYALVGVEALPVCIETHTERALPSFHMVGLPDSVVRESRTRVLSAIRNAGFEVPAGRIIVNLAPAEIPKEGSAFDLPLAIGLLLASSQIQADDLDDVAMLGELSLDGAVRPVRGTLPAAVAARRQSVRRLVVPAENGAEAAVVESLLVFPARRLSDAAELVEGGSTRQPITVDIRRYFRDAGETVPDFADVRGQDGVKRALEIAAAGGHNVLMIGPPGAGKTMLARRLPGLLPPLTIDEALETTAIHSVGGILRPGSGLVTRRPFRSPHHTVSDAGLVGGGANPQPGEISLAHNGVLFLDELPEFRRSALEVLRQPLEEGTVSIVRARMSVEYPARFMLVASMNPCPCGYLSTPGRDCVCSAGSIARYRARLSGPVLDRIDMHVEVEPVPFERLQGRDAAEESSTILARVVESRRVQAARFSRESSTRSNAQMDPAQVRRYCLLDREGSRLMKSAAHRLGLSARGFNRILKVARTIADLAGNEHLTPEAVAEAIQYRSLDRAKKNS